LGKEDMLMRRITRLAVTACAAAAVLAYAGAAASAERAIEIRPNEVTNSGRISIIFREALGGTTINCEISMSLEYARVIQKVWARRLPEGQIGIIPSARTANCRDMMIGWEVQFLAEAMTPFPMRYDAFLGVLPEITGLLITALRVGVRIRSRIKECLFEGELPFLVFESGGGQRFDRKAFLANTLNYVGGNCSEMSTIEIAGTLAIRQPIAVRLD
jgi:hypothetical protein